MLLCVNFFEHAQAVVVTIALESASRGSTTRQIHDGSSGWGKTLGKIQRHTHSQAARTRHLVTVNDISLKIWLMLLINILRGEHFGKWSKCGIFGGSLKSRAGSEIKIEKRRKHEVHLTNYGPGGISRECDYMCTWAAYERVIKLTKSTISTPGPGKNEYCQESARKREIKVKHHFDTRRPNQKDRLQ